MSSFPNAATRISLFSTPLTNDEIFEEEREKQRRDQVDLINIQLSLDILRDRFLRLFDSMVKKYHEMPGEPIEIVALEDRFLMTFYPPRPEKTMKCHWCSHQTRFPRYFKLEHLQSKESLNFTAHTIHEVTQHLFFGLNVKHLAEVLELIPSNKNYEIVYGS